MNEFDEIRPYEEGEMSQAFEELINDRQFSKILQGFVPWLPKTVRNGLLRLAFIGVKTPLDFQLRFMKPIVKYIIRKHSDGLTFNDSVLGKRSERRFTFVSNHRDIVLDSAFLDVLLSKHGYPTTVEIGIGDNLLIYPWIKRLVRMNKAFTVRRGLTAHEMMRSSQLMSRYIHYAVTQKKENIWIAQREGRAKDSNDRTQDSVLKMLAMGGEGAFADQLRDLNIVPLTISYEYDPCDYLKAQEFQQKRDNPSFKKSKQDDLDNMKTGIFGYKGRVHYHCGTPINEWLDELKDLPKNDFFKTVAQRMDTEIHRHYHLYPCNYIALDLLEHSGSTGNNSSSMNYTTADVTRFEEYLSAQMEKIKIPNKDEAFLRERMLTMYANPLRNYLAVQ
ncbi:MAG: 1-acyl-sn-glycerol-3-phosphate acyltransferase [Prevotella sp.]|nr:1-acyl-sn-glycerol-3-phosphate acyltransferase [Prevotella sp.]